MKTKQHTIQVRDKAAKKFKAELVYKKNISQTAVQSIIRPWKEYGTTVKLKLGVEET